MKIGYARVSTDDQNPDLQLTALERAGYGKIFTDKATGSNVKRPEPEKCLKALKAGDVLTVWKLDRLGRSLRDLIALLNDLKAKGVVSLVANGSHRHGNAHGPRHVANGRDTGRA
jgi:DNA invertase Pin-like site-specific DNA recombinase